MDNGQIDGRNEVSLLPYKKLTDFLGHEIEVSKVIAFHAIKNITSNPLSRGGHCYHIKNVLPKLRWNLILL